MASSHYTPLPEFRPIQEGDKFTFKPKALNITWGGDERYWKITNDAAELVQVSWLEVKGFLDLAKLGTNKSYTITFKMSTTPDAFGWQNSPVYVLVWPGSSRPACKKVNLTANSPYETIVPFTTGPSFNRGEKLMFGMYEIWDGRWKGGLRIHEVIIKPE